MSSKVLRVSARSELRKQQWVFSTVAAATFLAVVVLSAWLWMPGPPRPPQKDFDGRAEVLPSGVRLVGPRPKATLIAIQPDGRTCNGSYKNLELIVEITFLNRGKHPLKLRLDQAYVTAAGNRSKLYRASLRRAKRHPTDGTVRPDPLGETVQKPHPGVPVTAELHAYPFLPFSKLDTVKRIRLTIPTERGPLVVVFRGSR